MKRVVFVFSVFALAALLLADGLAQASSEGAESHAPAESNAKGDHAVDKKQEAATDEAKTQDDGNLTEGEVEQQGYEKRAALVEQLKQRVTTVQDGLNKLAADVKDDELKSRLVAEMQELSQEAMKVVESIGEAPEQDVPELEKMAQELMDKLDAFVEKIEKAVS